MYLVDLLCYSEFHAVKRDRQATDRSGETSLYVQCDIRYRVSCLHLVNSSDRLFNSEVVLFFKIVNFSFLSKVASSGNNFVGRNILKQRPCDRKWFLCCFQLLYTV